MTSLQHEKEDEMSGATVGKVTDTGATPEELPAGKYLALPASKDSVRLLCDEIGFPWDRRLERPDVLVAFVGELVAEVEHLRDTAAFLAPHGGKPPSEGSAEVLALTHAMLAAEGPRAQIEAAERVHEAAHRLNPDDAYPTDHLIDMLSSCASAVRFGLESPCRSRHAAAAADHVWKQVYGVGRFDSHTPAWGKEWARAKLTGALISLLPADTPTQGQDAASARPLGTATGDA